MIKVTYDALVFENVQELIVSQQDIVIQYDNNKSFIRPLDADSKVEVDIKEHISKEA